MDIEEQKTGKGEADELGKGKHWSEKKMEEMSERDWRIFREDNDIIIKGGPVPVPMRTWDESKLPRNLTETVRKAGYKHPTPIQQQGIPIGIEKRDLIALAPTGSGKSAAFLIPLIAVLQKLPPVTPENSHDGPYAVIVSPTRELAIQLQGEFVKFATGTKLRSAVIVGGKAIEDQIFRVRSGVELLIATPGRLKEALESKYLALNQCCWVVLDEADRMVVDPDFEDYIAYIMDSMPPVHHKPGSAEPAPGDPTWRVIQMFSATMSSAVERVARKYLHGPAYISIGEPGGGKKEIEQNVEMVSEAQKKRKLQEALQKTEAPIIVFANSKHGVEVLTKAIAKWGYRVVMYHGGKKQDQREEAIDKFKEKKYEVLVATDLAGRGLDVEGVQHVINFDAPKTLQDFIHRTGRTGRAGKKGLATTFLTNYDEELFYDLVKFLESNNQQVPRELAEHPATLVKPGSMQPTLRRKDQVIFAQ
eukprot:TRINITY_DN6553_c0_g1_i5.p1 TRINITY_DN6553_c0_g1~~TRINITY_DN6553_c0_g1_i5.p1  ORF type:complete len:476 (-),score=129.20 TRINITY_DN6553_c0_g1_i5:149-1576(-)